MSETIKTAGVIVIKDNKALLVRHGKAAEHLDDTYGVPAGRIDEGENAIQSAIRELREETGLITEVQFLEQMPEIYTATIERKTGPKTFSLDAFLCRNYHGELKATEESIPEWVDISELDNKNLLPNVKKMIMDGLKQLG